MNIALTYPIYCNVTTILDVFYSSYETPSCNPGVSIAQIWSLVYFQKTALHLVFFVHASLLLEDSNSPFKSVQSTRDYIVELFPDPMLPMNII